MDKKRVVITGVGLVTPIGTGVEKFWEAAINGTNGVLPLKSIDTTDFKTKTGGEVKDFVPEEYIDEDKVDKMGRASQFAIAATRMALEMAKLDITSLSPYKIGVSIGTTMGEPQILNQSIRAKYANNGSEEAIAPHKPRQYPCNSIPMNVAREFNVKGEIVIIPTACAAGNYAIGYAADLIKMGRADVVICGGSDPFSTIAFTGFNRLLATTQDVCRPFDKNRNGMAVSEGAGILILESLEHAQARGADILAEFAGYGLACDAYHMTRPHPEGVGGTLALEKAIKNSGIRKEEVDYICAHGTGTGENDKSETAVAKNVFGDLAYKIPMSSLKSMLGHTMGGASAIEAAACVLMIQRSVILPTINYETPDPLCDLDYVPNKPREKELNVVVSNAYAFGGNTSAIILKKFRG